MWGFDGNFFEGFSRFLDPYFWHFLGTPPADHHGGPLKMTPSYIYYLR